MYPGLYSTPPLLDLSLLLTSFLAFVPLCSATPELTVYSNYFDPAPSPEDGPPFSAGALRNPAYLPAQIGGIVGAYALSLVVVAAVLLSLAKTRRKRLTAGEAGLDNHQEYGYQFAFPPDTKPVDNPQNYPYPCPPQTPKSPIQNFSYPTPSAEQGQTPYTFSGSFSTYSTSTLGINLRVDQRVVAADREMAQQQLEEMYKYVLEQEAAKEAGTPIERPPTPLVKQYPSPTAASPKPSILKRGKNKPANLDLERGEPEKQSRASSILSALKSPRKKKSMKAISISSPIMTPMSGTFPRQDGEEMNVIPPRQYAPASPPPIPTDRPQYLQNGRHTGPVAPITPPDLSPESTQSIDERIGSQFGHSRFDSQAPTEVDPVSAVSDRSTAPLIGLPSSPKPNATRFPSLPGSPKPGATFPTSPRPGQSFSRPNAPSAVRTGGTLPLRAYEPALSSPSAQTTKQTTFERTIPLSPGARTPWTGAPVPYTPYQPFSPVVPVTPSLVTKADRKRMKQLQPKTPTMHMVQSSDDMW
ncbi:hypothetical protein ANO14919_032780 [Xylariales sp. No.14919]|nr:hypothetical protein F5X98DRAFT_75035 [Xylaria grammica]GAW13887.1 hypothetical protein ANO14919_032780 [Xylariales sp. No.14919]